MVSFTKYVKNKEINETENFDSYIKTDGFESIVDLKDNKEARTTALTLLKSLKAGDALEKVKMVAAKAVEGTLTSKDLADPITKNVAIAIEILTSGKKTTNERAALEAAGIPKEAYKSGSSSKRSMEKVLKKSTKTYVETLSSGNTPIKDEPVKDEPVKDEPIKDEPIKDEPVKDEPIKDKTPNIDKNFDKTKDVLKRAQTTIDKKDEGGLNSEEADNPNYFLKKATELKDKKIKEFRDLLDFKLGDSEENARKKNSLNSGIDSHEAKMEKDILSLKNELEAYKNTTSVQKKGKINLKAEKIYNKINFDSKNYFTDLTKKAGSNIAQRTGKRIAAGAQNLKDAKAKFDNSDTGRNLDNAKKAVAGTVKKVTGNIQDNSDRKKVDKYLPARYKDFVNGNEASRKSILAAVAKIIEKQSKAKIVDKQAGRQEIEARKAVKKAAKTVTPMTDKPKNLMVAKTAAEKVTGNISNATTSAKKKIKDFKLKRTAV